MTSDSPILISIFIPVFNGEKYLEATLDSIVNQSYTNFEVLLVDDSSTDKSLSILNFYAEKDLRFKVFQKPNGGMVAKSMNFINSKISGDYYFYSSQDDIFSEDLLEKMVLRHTESQADSILPDMEFYFENKTNNKITIGLNGNRSCELTGREAFLASLNWTIHGFALFKTDLLKEEFFPEDAFDSDEYVTRKLFLKSNKVVFSEGVFYYRQDNADAITKTFSVKNFYVLNTSWKIHKLLEEYKFDLKTIYNSKLQLIQRYLDLYSYFETFHFDSEESRSDVKTFLINFSKTYFTIEFLKSNFNYGISHFKWKFFLLGIVVKIPLLRDVFVKFKIKKRN
ncbi:glycosyltransferase family 2 protein [Flavobacterium sp.]|uniref:glycosyltransferase family 2 protein n=1 Tax=Flavobacterium sp. TaxID=239 RepID=UPI00262175EF|nr:glycosyltransferase family 2 protein [Flavobacterium sp.]MDD3003807.1 glycosyltransferase family 2 protein [Flavobacterium sp.]